MKFKLAVSDKVTIKVEGTMTREDGSNDPFKFVLFGIRIGAKALTAALTDEKQKASDLLRQVVTGWKGQKLVLNEDDTPADFGEESFDTLLEAEGMATYCLNAYLKEVQAKAKN